MSARTSHEQLTLEGLPDETRHDAARFSESDHAEHRAPRVFPSPGPSEKTHHVQNGRRSCIRSGPPRHPRSGRISPDSAVWLDMCNWDPQSSGTLFCRPVLFALRAPCRIVGCSRIADYVAQVLCRVHYGQLSRMIGPPNGRKPDGRGAPRKDVPGYAAAHYRTEARYGHAWDYCCQLCPARAEQWALPPSLAALACPVTGLRYSPNPEDYMPLCASCHTRLDRRNPPRPGAEVLPLEVPRPTIHRERWTGGAA